MNTSIARQPRTQGEKSLLAAVIAFTTLAALGTLWWGRANTLSVVPVSSPPPMPARNAFDSFNAAARAETQKNAIDDAGLSSPYTPAQTAAAIQANAPVLRLLRQGLTLPYQNPASRSFNTRFPYYANFRALARLLSSEGRVRESQGDWAGAMGDTLDSIHLGEKIPRCGPLIGEFVGVACQAIGRKPAWPRVDHLSAAQARAAARRLEQIGQSHVPLADVLQEEEWATQASLLEKFRQTTWRSDLWQQIEYTYAGGSEKLLPLTRAQIYLSSQGAILGHYTATMDGFVRDARRPFAIRPRTPLPDPLMHALAAAPCDRAGFLDALTQTENTLLLVTLALRAYRLEHGAYPATLCPRSILPGARSR